ncbi:uncharacterized protein [Fopius arisanus]|uniref:Or85d protein n=1 Tax=Fopius arisanus TaxID=64838 RepID=A0A0C9QCE2_9HYME|nr:PREDICTED: uncharacterized protein LOC105270851 isoform X2 [Fopius arisanus]
MTDKVLPPGKSYIAFNLKCLTYLGNWNPWNHRRGWVYHVYTFVMLFMMSSRIHGYFVAVRELQQDFLQQTLMLVLISTFSVGVLKHINILWHHSDVLFLTRSLTWERSLICSKKVALYRNELLRKVIKFTKDLTVIWLWLVGFDLPLFYREFLDGSHRTVDHLSIRMMRVLRKIYGLILLPQLISSTSLITFVGIHVFVTKTVNLGDPSSAGVVVLTLFSSLIQLGVYCLAGNSIIVASDLTTFAAYNCQWYREDAAFKKKMSIFLSMSKKPMSISAIGLFELSCVTLKNVLTKSYSAMAVLQKSAE